MKKEKILLSVTVASMIAAGGIFAINGGLKSSSAFATGGEVWHHYAAVAPTETTHGSKEFWARSTDGCATHTFDNPGVACTEHDDFSTYDSFATLTCDDDRYVPSGNESLGITPMVSTKNKTVTYGLYPQTVVDDESLIKALNKLSETSGYYFHENAYYAKVEAAPLLDDYEFNNGTTIVSGTTYWFRCEPITWDILSNSNGEYYILSSVLLDAHCFYNSTSNRKIDGETIHPNNYEYSDIRAWLRSDFYNSAFALDDSHIQTTTVDSSASTTYSSPNPYACNNTKDKVFLPSYRDYINSSYGFSTSQDITDTRCCKTTDWARARGAYYDNDSASDQYNNGFYWTRSPDDEYSNYAWIVSHNGILNYSGQVNNATRSVRPAISITIA